MPEENIIHDNNSSDIIQSMSYTPDNTKIAVIGGGNIGTQLACVCASKGYEVRLLSSRPSLFSGDLEIVDENDNVTRGHVSVVSASYVEVVSGCRIVFVTHPAFLLEEVTGPCATYIISCPTAEYGYIF